MWFWFKVSRVREFKVTTGIENHWLEPSLTRTSRQLEQKSFSLGFTWHIYCNFRYYANLPPVHVIFFPTLLLITRTLFDEVLWVRMTEPRTLQRRASVSALARKPKRTGFMERAKSTVWIVIKHDCKQGNVSSANLRLGGHLVPTPDNWNLWRFELLEVNCNKETRI